MQIFKEIIQGTDEWKKIRCGVPTASNFDKIITETGAPSKQADDYALTLAMERITGQIEETFKSKAMISGTEREVAARMEYELVNGCTIEQVGFCLHDSGMFGASPDGMRLDIKKGLELKNPISKTYAFYKLNPDQAYKDYKYQVQGSLLTTEYESWDLCIGYPGADLIIYDIKRDEQYIDQLYKELYKFDKLVKSITERLLNK